MSDEHACFISVDIEASGPVPGEYSMLSLGACVVGATEENFYVELAPITRKVDAAALAVSGFDLDTLAQTGTAAERAMAEFAAWLARILPRDVEPVFVAYPLAFDWMFVAYYFHRFLGHNPFGYSGLDVKSFYMGLTRRGWHAADEFPPEQLFKMYTDLTHNAREDAIAQAQLFAELLALAEREPQP